MPEAELTFGNSMISQADAPACEASDDSRKPREEEGTFAVEGATLYRRAILPAGTSTATLAIVHGYGDHSGRYVHFMRWMAERGVACHAVDLRGQGKSSGRRGYFRKWDDYLADLSGFLDLPVLHGKPLFILGHSHGGLVTVATALRGKLGTQVRGCILSSPFFRSGIQVPPYKVWFARTIGPLLPWLQVATGVKQEWLTADESMRPEGRGDPLSCRVATPRWFLEHALIQTEVLGRARDFKLPLFMLLGDADPIAQPQAGENFFAACGSADKALQVYRGQRHELLREVRREQIFRDIWDWVRIQSVRPKIS